MNAPVPIIFIVTMVLALVAGAVSDGERGIVTVYSVEEPSADWSEATAPIDRRIALVLDEGGRRQLGDEIPSIKGPLARQAVDFDKEIMLVASMGVRPTGGYSIHIVKVQAIPEKDASYRIHVQLAADEPDKDDAVIHALTYPVDVVAIARDQWPSGLLDALANEHVLIEVVDQDGRPWGPAFVYSQPGEDAASEEGEASEKTVSEADAVSWDEAPKEGAAEGEPFESEEAAD